MEPAGKLTFTLTYEELLKRVNSKYEYILHIQPGQIVKDYQADIYLNESLPLRSIHVPELKTNPNEITSELNPSSIATVERNIDGDSNRAHIVFKPDVQYQKLAAKSLVSNKSFKYRSFYFFCTNCKINIVMINILIKGKRGRIRHVWTIHCTI